MHNFKRILSICIILSTILTPAFFARAEDEVPPKTILCIGDSITQGRGGDNPEYTYRYPLWKKLIDYDAKAEFIGDIDIGFETTPTYPDYKGQVFNNKHHARWGWSIQGITEDLVETLKNDEYIPDISIIYLGTNNHVPNEDFLSKSNAMRVLIEQLRAANPNMIIILGEPFQEGLYNLGVLYKQLAKELTTSQSPIVIAKRPKDWFSPAGSPESCTIDSVHTSVRGDKMLADEIFPVLAPFLGITPEPVINKTDTKSISGWAVGGKVKVYAGKKLLGTVKVKKQKWALKLKTPLLPGAVVTATNTYKGKESLISKKVKIKKIAKPILKKVKAGAKRIKGKAQKKVKIVLKVNKKKYKAVKCNKKGNFTVKVGKLKKGSKIVVFAKYKKFKSQNTTVKVK